MYLHPESASATVVRTWTGWIRTADRRTYAAYLEDTGLKEYRQTPGNLGALAMFREVGDRTEVVTVSFWDDLDSIAAFAGPDLENAVFYADDDAFLIERDTRARNYRVA